MFTQYVVDTFAPRRFEGNPAAVCVVDAFPDDALMLRMARENALTHTAFIRFREPGLYDMRWFTPKMEVDLVGHATLAAGYVVTRYLEPQCQLVRFETKGGLLTVRRAGELWEMDFPTYTLKQLEVTDEIADALGVRPLEVWRARDLVCVFDDPQVIRDMTPDQEKLRRLKGALMQVTAPGDGPYDCVSRTFGPKMNMPEDPVCGSGHCHIIPYWAMRTGKTELVAQQASPRGGVLYCRLEGDRVILAGQAHLYSVSQLILEDNP